MNDVVISPQALDRIRQIHSLSAEYNRKVGKNHQERLLELMRKHVDEIEELLKKNNSHGLTEAGDLLVLCFELLLENKVPIDEVLLKCFTRYETKLPKLIAEEGKLLS